MQDGLLLEAATLACREERIAPEELHTQLIAVIAAGLLSPSPTQTNVMDAILPGLQAGCSTRPVMAMPGLW